MPAGSASGAVSGGIESDCFRSPAAGTTDRTDDTEDASALPVSCMPRKRAPDPLRANLDIEIAESIGTRFDCQGAVLGHFVLR